MDLSSTQTFDSRAARGPTAALAISKMRRTEVCSFLMLWNSAA
jgi:hypothetical protein